MKTTRITVETESLTIVRRSKATSAWCPDCRAQVEVITLGKDRLEEPGTAAQLQQWLGTGKLHFWKQADGSARICLSSLLRCFGSREAGKMVLGELLINP